MATAQKALESLLSGTRGRFTAPEAATATGLSIDEVRDALESLISKYVCRLQVTENGDLIYDFGKSPKRRDRRTFREHLQTVANAAWRAFSYLYKAWIAITLIVYFIIFLAILIAVLLSAGASSGGKKRKRTSVNANGILHLFYSIFRWRTHVPATYQERDSEGYRYRKYKPRRAVINKHKKNFIAAVYDFVFGPEPVAVDKLANQKEAAAFLVKERGLLVCADLCALAGWRFSQAETFLTDLLTRFNGKVDVSRDGAMYAEFDDVLRRAGTTEVAPIVYYWDEYVPRFELNGNTTGQNLAAAAMNGFNLFFAGLVVSGRLDGVLRELGGIALPGLFDSGYTTLLLGWVPLVFSILFFAIPAIRFWQVRSRNRHRVQENLRKRAMRLIFDREGAAMTIEEALAQVNGSRTGPPVRKEALQRLLDNMVLDFPGEQSLPEDGKLRYGFPRVSYELQEARRLRASKAARPGLGSVILDSE